MSPSRVIKNLFNQIAFPTSKTIGLNQSKGISLAVKGEISYSKALGHQERASLVGALCIREAAGLGVIVGG